ncbi:hypothetical protein D0469_00185 [Peribacillus saganii]|uniref:Uncharacterized protein n=1 Tax=Peribacillus saganii TaxID=2303992 RepID=A0A372LU29_9BACI|nr:hypothetical protein [Peribacillus saganii]RFU71566.1 hypothetical protein D0469_00185 [Peribacillus saganii]
MILGSAAILAICILSLLIIFLPLKLSGKGKLFVLATGILLSLMGLLGFGILPLWQIMIIQVAFSTLIAYFFNKKFPSFFYSSDNNEKDEIEDIPEIKPIYSLPELEEKAKMFETVDDFFSPMKKRTHSDTRPSDNSPSGNMAGSVEAGGFTEPDLEKAYKEVYENMELQKAQAGGHLDANVNSETNQNPSYFQTDILPEIHSAEENILFDWDGKKEDQTSEDENGITIEKPAPLGNEPNKDWTDLLEDIETPKNIGFVEEDKTDFIQNRIQLERSDTIKPQVFIGSPDELNSSIEDESIDDAEALIRARMKLFAKLDSSESDNMELIGDIKPAAIRAVAGEYLSSKTDTERKTKDYLNEISMMEKSTEENLADIGETHIKPLENLSNFPEMEVESKEHLTNKNTKEKSDVLLSDIGGLEEIPDKPLTAVRDTEEKLKESRSYITNQLKEDSLTNMEELERKSLEHNVEKYLGIQPKTLHSQEKRLEDIFDDLEELYLRKKGKRQ